VYAFTGVHGRSCALTICATIFWVIVDCPRGNPAAMEATMMDGVKPDWLPKGLTYAGGALFGGLIFEFKQMEQAKAFVEAVKERFGLWGQTFDNVDEAAQHTPYPFVLDPPLVLIERVWPEGDAEVTAVKRRFGLTARDIGVYRKEEKKRGWPRRSAAGVTHMLAEGKVEALALYFGGKFVGN
jgi:hypothetical protein